METTLKARAKQQAGFQATPQPAANPEPALQGRLALPAVASRMPVTQQVLSVLRERIVSGEWPPGYQLKSQRELAEQLGVSRPPLREAIASLEAFGLISVEPGRGMFVRQAPAQPQSNAQPHSTEDLYEARYLMEGWAAALAALSIGDEQLAELGAIVDAMDAAQAAQDQAELDRLDHAFHAGIASACRNALLRKLLAPIFSEHDMSISRIRHTAFISTRAKEHREILQALASRDPKVAQQAMHRHVLLSAQRAKVKLRHGIESLFP